MKRTVREVLLKGFSLDGYTVGAAVDLLNNFNRDAKIKFLTRWEYDTCFEIELEREQTDEEALKAEKDLQELLDYQATQERKEYERLKAKYEEKT